METRLQAAQDAFLAGGGTIDQWNAGVRRAIEAEITRSDAGAAVQAVIEAAQSTQSKPVTAFDRAYARMKASLPKSI